MALHRLLLCCLLIALGACLHAAQPALGKLDPDKLLSLSVHAEDTLWTANKVYQGTVTWEEQTKSYVITSNPKELPVRVGVAEVTEIEFRRTADDIVRHNGRIYLATKQVLSLPALLEWGDANNAAAAVLEVARAGWQMQPDSEALATHLLKALQKTPNTAAEQEQLINTTLGKRSTWEEGYAALAALYQAAGRQQELANLVLRWVENSRGSVPANQMAAQVAEARGDYRLARECFDRLWRRSGDLLAGVGLARVNLLAAKHEEAQQVASDVLAKAAGNAAVVAQAEAVLGSTLLRSGKEADAFSHLQTAVQGGVQGRLGELARYNLGLCHLLQGQADLAARQFETVNDPYAVYALAVTRRSLVPQPDALGVPALITAARELNATLHIEKNELAAARADLNGLDSARGRFLAAVVEVLASGGSAASAKALEIDGSQEALRWALYAAILAKDTRRASDVIAKLPATDGYAVACKVFITAEQGDRDGARELVKTALPAAQNPPAPRDYAATLSERFSLENEDLRVIDFNWPEGATLDDQWYSQAQGTNIAITVQAGFLVFGGTQTPPPPGGELATRAWTHVDSRRLRQIEAKLDLEGRAGARAGIEVMDSDRQAGIALAVIGQGQISWRSKTAGGGWTAWTAVQGGRIETNQVKLVLGITGPGSFVAKIGDATVPLTQLATFRPARLAVGLMAEADPGTTFRWRADELSLILSHDKSRGR